LTEHQEQQSGRPPIDVGNPHLGAEYPATIDLAPAHAMGQARLSVTIRCGPGTLTVLLTKGDAIAWGNLISKAASGLSDIVVPQPNQGSIAEMMRNVRGNGAGTSTGQ
jgi:hypothetical protein